MFLVDSHTHLYGKQFDSDRDEMMQRAFDAGVNKFYLPAIDSEVIDRMLEMEVKYPGQCFAMMGLHPCSVTEKYKDELKIVEDWLAIRSFPAIGEIGLDFYWDKTFTSEQIDAFHTQIQWALQYRLPIVIHTRSAMPETIAIVKQYTSQGLTGIFHCFGGTYEQAMEIIEVGFYLGIGGVVTYKNGGLAEVVAQLPLNRLVLETDAPYLTPVPYRGQRNESSYLIYIAQKIAELQKITVEEVAAATAANAEAIFVH